MCTCLSFLPAKSRERNVILPLSFHQHKEFCLWRCISVWWVWWVPYSSAKWWTLLLPFCMVLTYQTMPSHHNWMGLGYTNHNSRHPCHNGACMFSMWNTNGNVGSREATPTKEVQFPKLSFGKKNVVQRAFITSWLTSGNWSTMKRL